MNFLNLRKNVATLRRRKHRWQVQVRRKSRPAISRSFHFKSDALAWAREQELEADKGLPAVHKTLRGITVADIVSRYRDEVVPRKRGADRETLVLNVFLRHPLAQVALSDVTTGMVSAYCAEHLRRVKPGTLNRELDILRHAFATARRSWDLPLAQNVFAAQVAVDGCTKVSRSVSYWPVFVAATRLSGSWFR